MIDVRDIPAELMEKIRRQFDNDPQIQRLRVQQGVMQRSGNFREALAIGKTIEHLFADVVFNYMKEAESQVESISIENFDIPQEEKERIMVLGVVLFMCSDIIESSVLDIDDIIHKYEKDMHFEMFNDIRQVLEMAKEKLKFFQESSGYMKDFAWPDTCDDMYKMMRNKAASLLRKKRNNPSWGRNMEKYLDK